MIKVRLVYISISKVGFFSSYACMFREKFTVYTVYMCIQYFFYNNVVSRSEFLRDVVTFTPAQSGTTGA